MQLPGMFIEYFIIGAGSVFWLIILWQNFNSNIPIQFPNDLIVLIIVPVLYFLGMLMDYIGKSITNIIDRLLVSPLRKIFPNIIVERLPDKSLYKIKSVEEYVKKTKTAPDIKYDYISRADLLYKDEKISKQLEMRHSRHRIARGMFCNILLLIIIISFSINYSKFSFWQLFFYFFISIVVLILIYSMWYYYARQTSLYKIKAIKSIEKNS